MFERELYKSAFGASPLPVVLTDFGGNILEASTGFALLFEVQREDLVGVNIKEILDIEVRDGLETQINVRGMPFKLYSQKFEVEGLEFFVFFLDRIEQLRVSNTSSVLADIRDVFNMGLQSATFPHFVADAFPIIKDIFNADDILLLKRSKNAPTKLFIVYSVTDIYKEYRDKVLVDLESPNLLSIGMPILATGASTAWPSLNMAVKIMGMGSGWAFPIGYDEDFVDSLALLVFAEDKEPTSEEFDLMAFFSYLISLVYQKTEYKKEFEALSYKDTVSQTFSEGIIKELLNLQCEQAKRYDFSFSVMMIRITNYQKLVNIYGNHGVETSMQKVAAVLSQNLRRSDVLGRYGKDSFVIILPFTNTDGTKVVYERLTNLLKVNTFPPCKNLDFAVSITTYMQEDTGYQSIIERLRNLLRPLT